MKAFLFAVGLGLAGRPGGAAQNVSRAGTTAGAFLQIGVGPRATALGGAFTAPSTTRRRSTGTPPGSPR